MVLYENYPTGLWYWGIYFPDGKLGYWVIRLLSAPTWSRDSV